MHNIRQNNLVERMIQIFMISVVVLLLTTALAKLTSVSGSDGYLYIKDPLIGIPFRYLPLMAAVMEIIVAWLCVFGKSQLLKAACIGWLGGNLVIYRAGLWLIGYVRPCRCLGNLTTAIHLNPHTADVMIKVILAYLVAGSSLVLLSIWLRRDGSKLVAL